MDLKQNKGCNLLRLRGPLGTLGAISVQANLNVISSKRVEVKFCEGGWLGPTLPGLGPIKLLRDVQQSCSAWLDITVLNQQLRICRCNAGKTFALLKLDTIKFKDLIGQDNY